jgi:SAM-dependent methyltransferase
MPKMQPFEQNVERYEEWFDRYPLAYASEVEAVRALLPRRGDGLEVGVGTGRFAVPLGVREGIEPSGAMARLAVERGVHVRLGAAEALPCKDGSFDYLLMMVTVCFLDDVYLAFREAHRVLRPGGRVLVGFIDRVSPLGRAYEKIRDENVFYRDATFFSTDEVIFHLSEAGFDEFEFRQTIFGHPADVREADPVRSGYGEGSFVVVRGRKSPPSQLDT